MATAEGVNFTDEQRELLIDSLGKLRARLDEIERVVTAADRDA
jgi:hypothetical protein